MSIWDTLDDETRKKLREQYPEAKPPKAPARKKKRHHPVVAKNGQEGRRNMTITIHALERMEERWPDLCGGLTDEEIARIIQGEVNDALVANRSGTYCPLELANKNVERWRAKSGGWYCWTADKMRGYVCEENDKDGLSVKTVLIGVPADEARSKLQGRRR